MITAVPTSVQRKEGFDPHFCARLFMEAMKYKADITLSYQGRVFNVKNAHGPHVHGR
jgi:phosphotransferase system HPr-like phosphotransfer protein